MGKILDLLVPDIGDFSNVPIIELLVAPGDILTPDTPVVTLESDKASMEVPSEVKGVVAEVVVEEGDTVSEGSVLLKYTVEVGQPATEVAQTAQTAQEAEPAVRATPTEEVGREGNDAPGHSEPAVSDERSSAKESSRASGPAGPGVRRLARELGVSLAEVVGSGSKGRIRKEDIRNFVKKALSGEKRPTKEFEEPVIDFSQFGEISEKPLSRIQRISGSTLAGNWARIPHVTSFDEADITELDSFRRQLNSELPVKLTLLSFIIKAVQFTLREFPQFNSSLQGDKLIVKSYYHIGFAADTPQGLLVPVIRDVDKKGVVEIASEIQELATLARNGKLKPAQMQGGTFTVSSLGSVGGTHFTPIINSPEVGILALGRTSMQPVWDSSEFVPRLIMPLSLSWDHRALDGVTASRFNARLCSLLDDFRRVIL